MSASRYAFFEDLFCKRGDAPLIKLANGESISYPQFFKHSLRLLNFLVAQGVRHGDSVVINLENRVEYLELMLALALGGMTAYPVDPAVAVTQLNKIKQISKAALTITSYSQLAYALDDSVPECAYQGDLEVPYLVVFSSGTTGTPKGIVQTVGNFYRAAGTFAQALRLTEHDTTLHNWPMFYNAGLFNMFAAPLMAGGAVAIGKRFSAKHIDAFWDDIQRFRPSSAYLSPTMASSLARTFRFFKHDSNILAGVSVVSTSSILYPSIKKEFQDLFGVDMITCFGITELGGSFTVGHQVHGAFSVGHPIPGVEITIDTENNGELLVRTPYMALGYLDASGAIAPFDRNQPFHSGDLGRIVDGELFISGRMKDSIKKGGEFISLSEIEDMVLGAQLCDECLAIGRPDVFWGEVYDVYFVPRSAETSNATKDAINRLFNELLPQNQRPTAVKAVNEIPKTSSGKPLKRLTSYEDASHG